MTRPLVFPVIHVQHAARTLDNAAMAFEAGCDGVFLISMDGHCEVLEEQARAVKAKWRDKLVGINYLSLNAVDAIPIVAEAGLDMTWSDDAHVHTEQGLEQADAIAAALARYPGHRFFGGVAFKYKKHEPNPGLAAAHAQARGIIPTTSGAGTGKAAEVSKVELMSQAVRGGPLAIASGITPDNVTLYAPYLSHILVATGVSQNEHDFDFELLCQLMGKLKQLPPVFMFQAAHRHIVAEGLPGHTLVIGSTGKGRSMVLEEEAGRRGIPLAELEREMGPTAERKAAHLQATQTRKDQAVARFQSVREAYWAGSGALASEFAVIRDSLVEFLQINSPTLAQQKVVFDLLPQSVIGSGIAWGFDDTPVRDDIYGFVRENVAAVQAALELV